MEHIWSKLLYTLITRVSLLLVFIQSQIGNHKLGTVDAQVWSLIHLVWGWEGWPNKFNINFRDIVVLRNIK